MSQVLALCAFNDNYIWVIQGMHNPHVVVVDPGESEPVLSYLHEKKLILDAILLTHHHLDHTQGVENLLQHYPNIPVYSSSQDKVFGVTQCVNDGDSIVLENQNLTLEVIAIPGHTLGHIAFFGQNKLFCGDTLFSVGAGKIFEGTASQMYASLNKLANLPSNTHIFCGHEYTLSNIRFAQTVDPNNAALEKRKQEVISLRAKDQPSLPALLADELQINPFLRCHDVNIIHAVERYWGKKWDNPVLVFEHLRKWKNAF